MPRAVHIWCLVCAFSGIVSPPITPAQNDGDSPSARSLRILGERFGLIPADGGPIKCGLPVLASGLRQRSTLLPKESEALSVLESRPNNSSGVPFQTSFASGGFRFHFDTTGIDAPAMLNALHQRIPGSARAFIDSAASMMSYVSALEVSVLGFDPPPSDGGLGGGAEYDIYVLELGTLYGETIPDNPVTEGGRTSTFIRIDNDFIFVFPDKNKGLPGLRVTLAHEFHHAIQIGRYGFWTNDIWFHEITSVWMEDVVYTEVNDYYSYLFAAWSHFRHPETSFTTNDIIMYSRGVWGQYMTKAFGTDAMRTTWEHMRTVPALQALDDALRQSYASNFQDAFGSWSAWNAYTGSRSDSTRWYTEGKNYPPIAESMYDLAGGVRTVSGTVECLGSRYFRIGAGGDTLGLILTYTGDGCTSGTAPSFSFTVSRTKPDETFRKTASGLYLKLSLNPASQWSVWESSAQGPIAPEGITEGGAFPNPFLPDKQSFLYLPAESGEGTLTIFSQNMEQLYSAHQFTRSYLGHTVFWWDGKTNTGGSVATGVYVFVLNLPGRTVTGKFAVLRK